MLLLKFTKRHLIQHVIEEESVISVCCMKNEIGNVASDADGMEDVYGEAPKC